MTDVVCVGILVADVIARPVDDLPTRGTLSLLEEISLHGGGCALNTASGLARLGLDVAVAGKVGNDPFGNFLLSLLAERGIDASAVVRDSASPSSATVVLVDETGERTFLHVPGANARLEAAEVDPELLFAGRALHVAGAFLLPALDGKPTAELLAEARRRRIATSLDTAWDATGNWSRIEPCLPHLELFAASLAEAQSVTGEREPSVIARWLRDRGVGEVAIKLGARGCFVAAPGVEGHVDGIAADTVDETGAGDAFVAGLLYGRLAGWPIERAARLGNAVGALATTAVGAVEGLRGLDETLAIINLEEVAG